AGVNRMAPTAVPDPDGPEAHPQAGAPAASTRPVRDALLRLHDTAYLQTHPLARAVGPAPHGAAAGRALQQALLEAIDALRPGRAATGAHPVRAHRLLTLRYV